MRTCVACAIIMLVALIIASCSKADQSEIPKTDSKVDYGAYYFKISGGPCPSVIYEGDEVEKTDWDPNTGFIYLENDPDHDTKQIMTLYIYYMYVQSGVPSPYWLNVTNPLNRLATSCIVFGPGDIAQPRLYRPTAEHALDSVTIGENFIAGKIENWTYDRVLVYPDDEPELVTVNGWFVAKMR